LAPLLLVGTPYGDNGLVPKELPDDWRFFLLNTKIIIYTKPKNRWYKNPKVISDKNRLLECCWKKYQWCLLDEIRTFFEQNPD